MHDELELPDFLDRKANGIVTEQPVSVRAKAQKLVWPKKRQWAKIEARKRKQAKKDGTLLTGMITQRSGQ